MIVHETSGLIDIMSFKSFGTNVKPLTESPIGYFGTGLKYAIAVLVRRNQPLTIWIGKEPHEFFKKTISFRGKDFNQIYMRRKRGIARRWFSEQLPFTTELGKNWELWMAFRELHANTLDEKGQTYSTVDSPVHQGASYSVHQSIHSTHAEERTYFEVGGEDYENVWKKRDEIFLPHALDLKQDIQVFPGKSEFAYYRGLKAHKLGKPSLFTYNFNRPMELTEDRTLKDSWSFDYYLRQFLLKSEDATFVRQLVTAEKGVYEGNISWRDDDKGTASETFIRIVLEYAPKPMRQMFYTAPPRVKVKQYTWHDSLVEAIKSGDSDETWRIIEENRDAIIRILQRAEVASSELSEPADDMPF